MNTKQVIFTLLYIVLALGLSSCSKDEPHPEDYIYSILSGEYSKDGMWKLHVYDNNDPVSDFGSVKFLSKDMTVADVTFIDVLPGNNRQEFKNLPLSLTSEGYIFTAEDNTSGKTISVTGTVSLGEMTIRLSYAR